MIRKSTQSIVAAVVVTAFFAFTGTAQAASFKLSAKLVPNAADPTASGRITWELDRTDGSMRLNVDLAGITVDDEVIVLINWQAAGTVQLVDGHGQLQLDSEEGDFVLRAKAGQNVTIFSPNCWVVCEGTLAKK